MKSTAAVDLEQALWFRRSALVASAGLQIGCSIVFLSNLVLEWAWITTHAWVELAAVIALLYGAWLGLGELRKLAVRHTRAQRDLDVASGGFQTVIEWHFETWGLSKAEKDVALLSIKGVSNANIARMRDTREGTIKAQAAAIYRKAGVSSRAELISVVIEDLIGGLAFSDRDPLANGKAPA